MTVQFRGIARDFFTDEKIVELSPLARLLFIGTWLEADREGRFLWRPKQLKLRYLPGDICDIEALAEELLAQGLVSLYEVDGVVYADIPGFTKNQAINNRESASVIPSREDHASPTREPRVTDASPTTLSRVLTPLAELNRSEVNIPSRRVTKPLTQKTFVPEDFTISDRVKAWANEKGHTRLDQHLEGFVLKAKAKSYKYTDWDAAFMEAIRKNWAGVEAGESASGRLESFI